MNAQGKLGRMMMVLACVMDVDVEAGSWRLQIHVCAFLIC
jgi:hypothetical protein